MSPGSSSSPPRFAWNAQTPARQSAWSSVAHRQPVRPPPPEPRALVLDALRDPEQVLDVVAHLVRDHVRLREVAGRAEPAIEITEERQVQVHLRVRRAVERPDRGAANPHADSTASVNSTSLGGT